MKQYIDKSAVVAEIERMNTNIKGYCRQEGHDARFDVVPEQLSYILAFLDTLEVDEEPFSEDLEEAAKIYTISLVVNEIIPDATVKQLREVADKSFKAGAEWQKEKIIEKACEWLENHNDYICGGTNGISWYNMQQLVKDFKKAMEE